MPLLRQDMAVISVGFPASGVIPQGPNLPFVASWASLEGGDVEAEDTKTRPGGMLPQIALGGPSTRTDATVTRQYSNALHPYIVQLENVAGRQAMRIRYQVLNPDGSTTGNPVITLNGILKTVTRPNFDANAQGAAFLSLVMSCNAAAAIGQ